MTGLADAARLAKARMDAARPRATVDLPLPYLSGMLGARFGLLSEDAMDAFQMSLQRMSSPSEAVDVMASFVADSCRVLLFRASDDAPWEDMTYDNGLPVQLSEKFAEEFELGPISNAADVVRALFKVEDGTVNIGALDNFYSSLLAWSRDTTLPVRGELVGESNGGAPS